MGTPEFDEAFVRFFMQHVVALNIAYDPGGVRRREVSTCFALETRGEWFLATAGHILENRYESLPKCRNVECSLFDGWRAGASQLPVPFPLLAAEHLALDVYGLDLGLIHIAPLFRRALEANGIRAFDETAWRSPPPDMVRHAVIGLPDQFIEQRTTTSGSVAVLVNPTFVYLEAVPPPPEMATHFPRFYGKLADDLTNKHTGESLTSMKGFSGSPILGFGRNSSGQQKYFLVAIQSGWRPDLRVVAGPIIPAIMGWIDQQTR